MTLSSISSPEMSTGQAVGVGIGETPTGDHLFTLQARNYGGGTTRLAVLRANTGNLIAGVQIIPAINNYTHPEIVQPPSGGSEFFVFFRNPGAKLAYATIDMSRPGNGTEANPQGEVTSYQVLSETNIVGPYMASIESRIAGVPSKLLFLEKEQESQGVYATVLKSIEISDGGIVSFGTLEKTLATGLSDLTGNHGDIDYDDDLEHLAVYVLKDAGTLGFFDAEVQLFDLDDNYEPDQLLHTHILAEETDLYNASVAFSENVSGRLYYREPLKIHL